MMKLSNYFSLIAVVLILGTCSSLKEIAPSLVEEKRAYDWVDPFIGTGGHGHTYPGATVPFGMVQLSPDTRLTGWDGCSAYHYTDSIIYGFSHTHLSGTGITDYGDVLLMPNQGAIVFDNGAKSGADKGYASVFKKENEYASPGFYQVHLDEFDIDVRLTATTRVGIHEYRFNQAGDAHIVLDLDHRDRLLSESLRVVSDSEVVGHRVSKEWAEEQHLYFVMQFSKPFDTHKFNDSGRKAAFLFDAKQGEAIMVKVGISAVSIDGARRNLNAEAIHWDFDTYLKETQETWHQSLEKIDIKDADADKKTIFYTALYHSSIAPNTYSDVDGQYRGMDMKVHSSDHTMYTVFSLWDTFRGTHPLYTIIEQKRTNEFINTFLTQYRDGGELPIWELAANYTGCMIGYHAVPVITDAYVKGLRDYDEQEALKAMVNSGRLDKLGLEAYKKRGFIEVSDEPESVSKVLEYAYDDWCIATVAQMMDEEEVHAEFIERAQYYKNIFNPEVGFVQSRVNGGWNIGFNPTEVNFNFTEANSWQYSMFAPHDITGLVSIYGGLDSFEDKLDQLFETKMQLTGRHQSDITGLIGQYAHGNEPSHHMAYLYNYIGKAHKTQARIHQILTEQYTTAADGLSGNEDCGQMSSWYVLSAMGFYSVTPGMDYYAIGKPHLEEVTIHLENGRSFTVRTNELSVDNKYIQSATLNGQPFNQSFLKHATIMAGGELVFEMGAVPNTSWGTKSIPEATIADEYQIVSVPYLDTPARTFTDSLVIGVVPTEPGSVVYCSIDNSAFMLYKQPLVIRNNAQLEVYATKGGKKSKVVQSIYKKIKGGRSIISGTAYNNQYTGGGPQCLIDFLRGGSTFKTGDWQGYSGQDVEKVVDLGEVEELKSILVGAHQDVKSWIWFPKSINISTSVDGEVYTEFAHVVNEFPDDKHGSFSKDFGTTLDEPINARFVKIKAENYGLCPDWHDGAGGSTWLFFDEIIIE